MAFDHLYGHMFPEGVTRQRVLASRDVRAETPAMANQYVTLVSKLYGWALDRGYAEINPAWGIRALKTGERARWPDHLWQRMCKHPSYHIRLAARLAVYTGQRQGDLLALEWNQFNGHNLHLIQEKTGVILIIPCHPNLLTTLRASSRPSRKIMTTAKGRPWTQPYFRRVWSEACHGEGIFGYQFHGLRKTAAALLAESGCSDREIMAITGHRTSSMVTKYTAQADQVKRATAAMRKLETHGIT